MKNLNTSIHKNKNALWVLLLVTLFLGCSDPFENDVTLEPASNDNALELSQRFKIPEYGAIDYQLPEVPDYFADEDDDKSFENEEANPQKFRPIRVQPGSNQLQGIIDNARPGTTIVLLAGEHLEGNTLVINHRVNLKGEKGAILSLGGVLGLAVNEANRVSIKNIRFNNMGGSILGIGIENSRNFEFKENEMVGFPISLVLEHADRARIHKNMIDGIDTFGGLGIVVMNGRNVWVNRNSVSGNLFGIWLCDKRGLCSKNVMEYNTFGMILCKVGAGALPFFSTGNGGSDFSATSWWVRGNEAKNNAWGYIVIDGANRNFLSNNSGGNNAFVDLELAGETFDLFGMQVPGSFNNTVRAGNLNYIDCGLNNTVYGGNEAGLPCSE